LVINFLSLFNYQSIYIPYIDIQLRLKYNIFEWGDIMLLAKGKITINLPVLLAKKRMQQKDLAEITEIRPATISALYNETAKEVSFNNLCLICEALECNLSELLEYNPLHNNE
jgi:putative transcriptional regulator